MAASENQRRILTRLAGLAERHAELAGRADDPQAVTNGMHAAQAAWWIWGDLDDGPPADLADEAAALVEITRSARIKQRQRERSAG